MKSSTIHETYRNHTSVEDATEAISKKLNVIGVILEKMQSDNEKKYNESILLLETYQKATDDERAILDYAMVCITGETMSNIIEEAKPLDSLEDKNEEEEK